MKRTTYLKIMGLGWCTPQFIVATPFLLLAIVCGNLERLFIWARESTEGLALKVGELLCPPKWWPSHKYLNELDDIRSEWRQETVDRLHGRVSRKDTPA